jgi:mono/diheme cytochrome c family protein
MTQKINRIALGLALVATLSVASAALADDLDKFPASTKTDVTFDKDIQPIFKEYCFQCHGPTSRFSGGLHLDTLAGTLKGGKDGKVVTPGKSAESDLVLDVARIGDSPMPPKPRAPRRAPGADTNTPVPPPPAAKVVPVEQVGLIRAWIDQGAK